MFQISPWLKVSYHFEQYFVWRSFVFNKQLILFDLLPWTFAFVSICTTNGYLTFRDHRSKIWEGSVPHHIASLFERWNVQIRAQTPPEHTQWLLSQHQGRRPRHRKDEGFQHRLAFVRLHLFPRQCDSFCRSALTRPVVSISKMFKNLICQLSAHIIQTNQVMLMS